MFYFHNYLKLFAFIVFTLFGKIHCENCDPFGVHLSLGDYFQRYISENDNALLNTTHKNVLLRINYMTKERCNLTYAVINYQAEVNASTPEFFNGSLYNSSSKFSVYIHSILITTNLKLSLNTDLYYTIHSNRSSDDLQKTFRLRIPNRDADPQIVLITGQMDLSSTGNVTFETLQSMANLPNSYIISSVLYTGNMAYNLETNDFENGINFLKRMQVYAAYWPIMPTAGPVDSYHNYRFFNSLFAAINDYEFDNNFYGFNLGQAHFVQFNMALYFDSNTNATERIKLRNWLETDLINANKSSNRRKRPWIIVYGFHSFYCSNTEDIYCGTHNFSKIISNATLAQELSNDFDAFEDMFKAFMVDLYISAGNTSIYERLPPIFKKTKKTFTSFISPDVNQLYMVNPESTVYIVEGVGGYVNTSDNKYDPKTGFTLIQSKNPGYGLLTIYNGTVLKYTHYASNSSKTADTDMFYVINTKTKWALIWEDTDKEIFAISFIFFVVIGGIILVVFMMCIESG